MPTIDEALQFFGHNQSRMARAFGVSRAAVSLWVKRGKLPALRAYQFRDLVEQGTTGNDR
jgi:predicted transcriptional regulator